MTENECIERLKIFPEWNRDDCWLNTDDMEDLVNSCVKALEEIQEYQAIGTVEQIERGLRFIDGDDNSGIVEDLRELHKYYLIGTVEECQEARERQMGKKPKIINGGISVCQICGAKVLRCYDFCKDCGQAIDWSGERVQKFRKKKGVQYEK